ncbi:hypothetical protein OAZ24_01405 [Synechococcus sp. AH-736-G21]|nr:hypothetical protein [Synechococcus sp. AH-736-G21]
MDTNFEQHYQAAERAYSLGDYTEAHAVTSKLWDQLQSASAEHEQSIVVGWQAVVSLLLGHIQLHGLQQPEEATLSYQRVLDNAPEATIAALAEQGLESCRAQHTVSEVKTTPASDSSVPELLKDPFLTTATDSDHAKATPPNVVTAMPWLSSDEEPRPIPSPAPTQTPDPDPVPSLEPTVTPEADSDVEIAKQKPEPTREKPPLDAVEPAPQEPAATKLLENSWLHVQLQPDIKSPTDSVEPMGLINRIKGIFAQSAGR